jgi:hypothetical protein
LHFSVFRRRSHSDACHTLLIFRPPPAAAAITNAIADATGQRLRDLPPTPDRIKAAIGI